MFEQVMEDDDKARKQFIRDLEISTNTHKVKRTVIYHPINTSNYYTTKANHCSHMTGHVQNVELLRSELLQSIRARARRLGIRSTERWETPGLKAILSSLQSKETSIKQVVKRMARDQVYHFQLTRSTQHPSRTPSLSSSTTSSSSSSSTLEPSPIDTKLSDPTHVKDVMILLRHTCQLMGITYLQSSDTSLSCVLTLRTPNKAEATQKRHHRQSQTSSHGSSSASSRYRLSLPILSHLTSSLTTSIFQKNKRQSIDQKTEKQGMTLFTIQIEPHKKQDRVNIRFSRTQGSNSVFKMAGGWIAGVMSLDGKIGH